MKNYFLKSMVGLLLMSSLQAKADDIVLGRPGYGGTGCPAGTASVTLSPDRKAISLLFDAYTLEVGRPTSRTIDRKSCNITVPVHVPQGMSVAIFQVDYRGFNSLPGGAYSRFDAEYFWAGSQGPRFTRTFNGPTEDNYLIRNGIAATSLIWSPCGASVNLRANTSMMLKTNTYLASAMSTVDTADIAGGLIYHIQWRQCH
jgi:hypothetical protein